MQGRLARQADRRCSPGPWSQPARARRYLGRTVHFSDGSWRGRYSFLREELLEGTPVQRRNLRRHFLPRGGWDWGLGQWAGRWWLDERFLPDRRRGGGRRRGRCFGGQDRDHVADRTGPLLV